MKNKNKKYRKAALALSLLLALGGMAPARAAALQDAGETHRAETEAAGAAEEVSDVRMTGAEAAEESTEVSAMPTEASAVSAEGTDSSAEAADWPAGAPEATETSTPAADLDYILGRPMTEAEIAKQKAMEPKNLPADPVLADLQDGSESGESGGLSASTALGLYATLPSAFDARTSTNLITSVKNQLPYGTCWAFSTLASGEASLIRRGAVVNGKVANKSNLDLSELQLLYFFYHPVVDELGNTAGDTSSATGGGNYLWQGSHGICTTFALASWLGATAEEKAPYSMASTDLKLENRLAWSEDVAHMQNSYWVLMSDRSGVKELIREYGSVSASFYWDQSTTSENYNYSTGAYNNTTVTGTNHAVNLVGWDDNYSRDNFYSSVRPASNGAWLVKNNWGSAWGDAGYFWISYEDMSFTDSVSYAYVYDFEAADNYDHIYQYDGSWSFKWLSMNSGQSVANVFRVSGSDLQEVKAVSLSVRDANVDYSLQIYRNPNLQNGGPTSGTPVLKTPQTGMIPFAGYTTIELEQSGVNFRAGDTFSVVLTLWAADGKTVRVITDESSNPGSWLQCTNATAPGQSFLGSGGTWLDLGLKSDPLGRYITDANGNTIPLGNEGVTVRLKAFTKDGTPIQELRLNQEKLSLSVGETATLTSEILPANATEDKTVTWTSSDSTKVTVANGVVKAVAVGTVTITASAGEGRVKAVCQVNVQDAGAPATPVLRSMVRTGNGLKVRWNKVTCDGYRIYRKEPGTGWKGLGNTEGSRETITYHDRTAKAGVTYTYTVRAYNYVNGKAVLSSYDEKGVTITR